jgi:hypothetical protein
MDTLFLWGGAPPRPTPGSFYARGSNWWRQYSGMLCLSSAAIAELHRTSCDIVSLLPDPISWGASPTPFRGLVVGAVQSGKTGSMIGVTSIAIDQGYRMVVVLAGGKDDLRQQTARRFNTQLIIQRDDVPGVTGTAAYTLPLNIPDNPSGGVALPYSIDIHQWSVVDLRVRKTLVSGGPCIFVIKKNLASLTEMRRVLSRAYDEFGEANLPTLILDDECDDASVDVEAAPIPVAIANLWRNRPALPVAYAGYTATAAANLLQAPDNELYPEHFVYLLRYPAEGESPVTVPEQNPDKWYSGSECFYAALGDTPGPTDNFLVNASVSPEDIAGLTEDNMSLKNAVRAYILSGAYRLALQPNASFADVDNLPAPHTMLVQTSMLMDEHERTIRGLATLWGDEALEGGYVRLSLTKVDDDIAANEVQWRRWYDEFSNIRERLYLERPSPRPQRFASWDRVRALIPEVIRNVRIKAINSDPVLRQELDYAPQLLHDGTKLPPSDIYVIVIGGSRLSRGITLEGLCISYFTRWVTNPTEDTVLQISRWFGYRGEYLEFVRLFTTMPIYEALVDMHENDRDLRFQLANLMKQARTPREAGLVLRCSPRALPTGKLGVGRVYDLKFSPYQSVFRSMETGVLAETSQQAGLDFLSAVRGRHPVDVRTDNGRLRGVLSRGWTAIEVADVLDSLCFSFHNPQLEGNPAKDFHRPPDPKRTTASALAFRSDPYQVAAYLREWSAKAEIRKADLPPLFDVGVAYGDSRNDPAPFDFPLMDRTITADGKLVGEWTGRSAGWRGDSQFDSPNADLLLAGSSLRGVGLRGLLLLYVVHRDAQGRQGVGIIRNSHSVTFGISIPDGGPELRRVTVSPTTPNA